MVLNVWVSSTCPSNFSSRFCHRSDADDPSEPGAHPEKCRHSPGCQHPGEGLVSSLPPWDIASAASQNMMWLWSCSTTLGNFSPFWDKCPSHTSLGMHVRAVSTASSWKLPPRASPEGLWLGQGSHPGMEPHLTASSRPFQNLFLQDKMSATWCRTDV